MTATDAKNKTTTHTFDVRGRQTKITDRLGRETVFAYTARGQLASLTDAENQITSYTYSALGQKLTETYPDHVGGNPGEKRGRTSFISVRKWYSWGMPRRPRICPVGECFHVLNRSVARLTLFEKTEDYDAFERVVAEAFSRDS
ncbi:MAG: RHS repeat domain-containing protein, partial [Planctomycetota bacterium]